jgi:predicted DNA-binding transcriptional regulator YafY
LEEKALLYNKHLFCTKVGSNNSIYYNHKKAKEYWAMQYLNTVEVISPISLREKLKQNLKNAMQKYND